MLCNKREKVLLCVKSPPKTAHLQTKVLLCVREGTSMRIRLLLSSQVAPSVSPYESSTRPIGIRKLSKFPGLTPRR